MDGKVGHSPERRRLGKNGEVEEFAGKRERGEMVGQEEEIVGGEIVGKGWLTLMQWEGEDPEGENLEVRGGAVRQGRKMTSGDNGGAAVWRRRRRPVVAAAAA